MYGSATQSLSAVAEQAEGPRDGLRVTAHITIPRNEIEMRASRSGGPGGQHVNTSSTRIDLQWQPGTSAALNDAQRARVVAALSSRLDTGGWLRLTSSEHRSQLQNRDAAEARLIAIVKAALYVPKVRRPTKPTHASKTRRLEAKTQRKEVKQQRRRVSRDD
jgi:ribosome-associated protein